MMLQFACPSCAKTYQSDELKAGSLARCKCGERFRIPEESREFWAPTPDPTPLPSPRPSPAGEPWFYGFIEKGIRFLIFVDVGAALLSLVGAALLFLLALANEGFVLALLSVAWIGGLLLSLLAGLVWLAFGLLLIDIGRSVRAVQRNTNR